MGTRRADLGRGYAVALASAAVLSLTAIFIRYLTVNSNLPALVLAFWREILVALCLGAVLAVGRPALLRVRWEQLRFLLAYGVVLATFNALWTVSVALNGAAVATVIAYSSAAFTALLGWWLLRESLGPGKVAAVALCLCGCAVVSGAWQASAWQGNASGVATGLLSGLAYSVYSLMGRRAAQTGISPWTALLYTFAFAALCMLAVNLSGAGVLPGAAANAAGILWPEGTAQGWGLLLALAAGPTLVGYGLYNLSLGLLPSSTANLLATVELVFTAIVAWLVLGERFTWAQVLGSGLIWAGVLWLRLTEPNESS
ncbi:MAG TPA: DMT family transporter [Anaerolineae bacterium]|nr:DMT family transporter [Anaerolineae bacterium]